jgi:UDPglucose 6-dehydrogenase
MKLAIIGHGYVGLVTAAVFADLGNNVVCVGRTAEKIENLKKGKLPFFEPGLEEVVKENINAKRLVFTLDYKLAVSGADVVFICVGTPSLPTGEADLSSIFKSAEEIAKNLTGFSVIACKSTVPVGTNRKVANILKKYKQKTSSFEIASCPEFLREGTALHDTLNPDRIIIGVGSEKAKQILLELHKPINGQTVVTKIETAELIKYASNTILATKISFANELAFFCEAVGADIEEVIKGVGLDKRIGSEFLAAGIGYGGSCFPKDVKALVSMTKLYKTDCSLFSAVESVNKLAHEKFIEKILKHFKSRIKGIKIGVLGLSFKPETDDMRDAPSIPIIKTLLINGADLVAYDPQAMNNAQSIFQGLKIKYMKNAYDACSDIDALLILTEWNEFKQLDLDKIKKMMKKPVVFDGRNIYDPAKMKKLGFIYYGVGR